MVVIARRQFDGCEGDKGSSATEDEAELVKYPASLPLQLGAARAYFALGAQ
jgi:hypothetical protein